MVITTSPPVKRATSVLREIFAQVEGNSCPYTLNFHLHSCFSDGQMHPRDIVEQAVNLKIRHFAITDHHTIEGYEVARQELIYRKRSGETNLPQLWTGVEINASLLFTEVHILGYDFDPRHPALLPYLQSKATAGIDYQAVKVINAIHQAGGIAVLAHPARYRRPARELIVEAAKLGIDGVETYYSYENCDPWQPTKKVTAEIKPIVEDLGLLHTCGTDSHGLKITRRI
ncbi:MAG: PHP domain-containing protein [Pseudanabaenaceae cyanobacterium]